jgi:hypothetical protein
MGPEAQQQFDPEEQRFALGLGNVITLEAFDLGPSVNVPQQFHGMVEHPRKSSKLITRLHIRQSFHEYYPQFPGEHGILYLDRKDLPKYLVITVYLLTNSEP